MSYTTKDIANGKASVARTPTGTQKRAGEVQSRFPAVKVIWGDGPGEHATGLALDFMVAGDRTLGDAIANYLWDNRIRLGVEWIIYRQRIRNPAKAAGVWRNMEDRGSPTENHMDHVHVKFSTSSYTSPPKPAPTVPRYPGVQLRRGSKGSLVSAVQTRLKARGWTITVDASYGPSTENVVRQFQLNKKLKADGVVGPATWAALWSLPIT